MHVALIDPLGQYAGNHHYTDQLARGLTRAGVAVSVFTHGGDVDHSPDRPYEYLETFFDIYGQRPAAIRGLQFLRCLANTFAGIARRHCEIVHVQLWQHDIRETLQVLLARLLGKKVVVTVHDIVNFGEAKRARSLKWMLRRSSGIVVHNRYCEGLLKDIYHPEAPVAVIPHVNQAGSLGELPERQQARTKLNLPADKLIFLFFGNCRQEKGLDIAFRALAQVDDDNILFVTAGKMKPHEEAQYRGLAAELGLGDRLRMDVALIPDDVALAYYRAADAVVVPYRQVYESGVAITASTCGRAVIASDLPPLLEITQGGESGIHFRNGSVDDLVRAMTAAITGRSTLDELGAKAQEKALRERDPDTIGRQTADLYMQISGGAGA